jgi:hypothetical protein
MQQLIYKDLSPFISCCIIHKLSSRGFLTNADFFVLSHTMSFAEKELKKYGWQKGKGLGKNNGS